MRTGVMFAVVGLAASGSALLAVRAADASTDPARQAAPICSYQAKKDTWLRPEPGSRQHVGHLKRGTMIRAVCASRGSVQLNRQHLWIARGDLERKNFTSPGQGRICNYTTRTDLPIWGGTKKDGKWDRTREAGVLKRGMDVRAECAGPGKIVKVENQPLWLNGRYLDATSR